MAGPSVVSSISTYLAAVADPKNRLELISVPATPWYLGQPDMKGDLAPAFYKSGIRPDLEREVLRDYRQTGAEFVPTKGASDADIMISAHMNALPSRVIEWSANPLVALFLAAESMNAAEPGRVWVLNPWLMNQMTAGLAFVPPVDSDHFKKYVVKLDDPSAPTAPEAVSPMAFRPLRTTRNYNLQNIYWTVHGGNPASIHELKYFVRGVHLFVTWIVIAADAKKSIMKELHDIGVTRSNLFPGLASLTRTLAYRYSKNYIGG